MAEQTLSAEQISAYKRQGCGPGGFDALCDSALSAIDLRSENELLIEQRDIAVEQLREQVCERDARIAAIRSSLLASAHFADYQKEKITAAFDAALAQPARGEVYK